MAGSRSFEHLWFVLEMRKAERFRKRIRCFFGPNIVELSDEVSRRGAKRYG